MRKLVFRPKCNVQAKHLKVLVGKDDTRPIQKHVHVCANNALMGATNSHMLGMYPIDVDPIMSEGDDLHFQLPVEAFDLAKFAIPEIYKGKTFGDPKDSTSYFWQVEAEDLKEGSGKCTVSVYLDYQGKIDPVRVYSIDFQQPDANKNFMLSMLSIIPLENKVSPTDAIGFNSKLMSAIMAAIPDHPTNAVKMTLHGNNRAMVMTSENVDFGWKCTFLLMPVLLPKTETDEDNSN